MIRARILWILLCVLAFTSCNNGSGDCDAGEGDRFEDRRNFENFHTFILDIPGEVILITDTNLHSSEVVILGQRNVTKEIKTTIANGVISASFNKCFKNNKDIRFTVRTPWLQRLVVNSAAQIRTEGAIFTPNFTIESNASGSMDLTLKSDSLTTFLKSGSTVTLNGYASRQILVTSSSGRYLGSDLISDSTVIQSTSTNYTSVYCTGYLIATNTSAGVIDYTGEDTLNVTAINLGSGSINDLR